MIVLYDTDMSTERITITLESEVLAFARERAEAEGLSLSAWLNRAAERERKLAEGRQAIEEIWEMIGHPTPEERAAARRMSEAVLSGADQETIDRINADFPRRKRSEADREAA
jgi:hypothetical protein